MRDARGEKRKDRRFNHKYIISHYAVGFIRSLATDNTDDE